jgi:tetratricopeptide (TPR) repeat protein
MNSLPTFRTAMVCAWLLCLALACSAQDPQNWLAEVRAHIAARDLPAALQIARARLAESPSDLEARGWHARLLAWSGRWTEAEADYRAVLQSAPQDTDILVGLAQVLTWQTKYHDALALLNQAELAEPLRADVYLARGRTLRAMGQLEHSRAEFQRALQLEPANEEAQAAMAALLTSEPRFTLRFGSDIDTFNFGDAAYSFTTRLTAQLDRRWVASFSLVGQNRFGEGVAAVQPSVSYRLTRSDSLAVGAGIANAQAVSPTGSFFVEYGHGFSISEERFLQGIEASYKQQWYWYQGAAVVTFTPLLRLNLARQLAWSLQITAAKSDFANLPPAWSPSGVSRVSFPIYRTLQGSAFFAVGTEDFAGADQIGSFSARTWGAGFNYERRRHQFTAYLARQDRSQDRTQTSYGGTYAIRF